MTKLKENISELMEVLDHKKFDKNGFIKFYDNILLQEH